MSILYVDLDEERITSGRDEDEKGTALALSLLEKTGTERAMVFIATPAEALPFKGASTFLFAFTSPLTGRRQVLNSVSDIGLVLMNMGYTALVLKGRARHLSYISFRGDAIELKRCEFFRSRSFEYVASTLGLKDRYILLSTSRAADSLIAYAALYEDGVQLGSGGLGYVFSSMNLKAMVFQTILPERTENDVSRRFLKKLADSRCAGDLKRDGSASFICKAVRYGYAPIAGFSRRFDPRADFLDGMYLKEKYGAYSGTCSDCPVSCRKLTKNGYNMPDLEDVMFLGTNLSIFSPESVMYLKMRLFEAGLEVVATATVLAEMGITDIEKIDKVIDDILQRKIVLEVPHAPFATLDYRGCYEGAILYMLGETIMPLLSMHAPIPVRNVRSSAILALYGRLYANAIVDRGYPLIPGFAAYLGDIPLICYRVPWLLRRVLRSRKMFGIDADKLLEEGLAIVNRKDGKPFRLPDCFVYKADVSFDPSTVSPTRLMECYRNEKLRLEVKLCKKRSVGK